MRQVLWRAATRSRGVQHHRAGTDPAGKDPRKIGEDRSAREVPVWSGMNSMQHVRPGPIHDATWIPDCAPFSREERGRRPRVDPRVLPPRRDVGLSVLPHTNLEASEVAPPTTRRPRARDPQRKHGIPRPPTKVHKLESRS